MTNKVGPFDNRTIDVTACSACGEDHLGLSCEYDAEGDDDYALARCPVKGWMLYITFDEESSEG